MLSENLESLLRNSSIPDFKEYDHSPVSNFTPFPPVPKLTLHRFVHQTEYSPEEVVRKKLGRKPVLPPYLEDQLVEYLWLMERKYYGLTRKDVKVIAFQLTERNNLKYKFGEKEEAGRAWLDH